MLSRRFGLILFCGFAAGFLLGCQENEIQRYQVAKPEVEKPTLRLLAAVFPQKERTWFFKVVGPIAEVEAHKQAFDRFIHSVRFTGKAEPPVTWTVPDGWEQKPGSDLRYATFHFGPKEKPLELTVVALGAEAGSTLGNVNRWRGQLGLRPVSEAGLGQFCTSLKVEDVTVTMVDMSGPGVGGQPALPPMRPPSKEPAAKAESRLPLAYQKPDGWKERPNTSGFALATFQAGEGNPPPLVTITALAGMAGGLTENVKRWRGQLQLPPVSDEEAQKDIRQFKLDGMPAHSVDLSGPASAGAQRQRLLGVVVSRGSQTWFFKMIGPAVLVEKQKAAFEGFVASVKFNGGSGANHE
jgi:hypothetical protein